MEPIQVNKNAAAVLEAATGKDHRAGEIAKIVGRKRTPVNNILYELARAGLVELHSERVGKSTRMIVRRTSLEYVKTNQFRTVRIPGEW